MINDLIITGKAADKLAKAKERYRKEVAEVNKRAQAMRGLIVRNKKDGLLYQVGGTWPDESHALSVYCLDKKGMQSARANPCEFEIVEGT